MVEAKQGNIDIEFFKNIIQYEDTMRGCNDGADIYGWIIKFLYRKEEKCTRYEEEEKVRVEDCMDIEKFGKLASQMLILPFKVIYDSDLEYDMIYKVGFIGCDQNEKNEVYPVQGWIVSLGTEEEEEEKEKHLLPLYFED